ncbi:proline/glycine betaine ABC transporter permease [Clostridium sp. D2Q-11]|uniref:Proline/glycine betaine ABC transporter permease n=1 Tax=Anaeromonas frigoriresistens TaxID=2683708 RepID=A0A942V138_9FIRM|nr:proline/glycine betaine ABC transporter permease [Anaeromonas frigoriresistens]MBS4539247.1 proline/glycine betaine ABC transporter permease [Anaeromonas frigoriresistens]
MFKFHIGSYFEDFVLWLKDNFDFIFDFIKNILEGSIDGLEALLNFLPSIVLILLIGLLAWKVTSKGVAIFTILGLLLIDAMELWQATISTLALVLSSSLITLLIGIPLGILASKNDRFDRILRPILDFMQTMPAFVYLIPAVLFFSLGKVPGAFATIIFSMPPVVRLTNLAIRQVPTEVVEAARSFGSTSKQMLFKVQLPIALPTILAGINQTIMLALSMVVISAMIGSGGLGKVVLRGIQEYKIGLGFEGGVAVVILAMILDRITQGFGDLNKNK